MPKLLREVFRHVRLLPLFALVSIFVYGAALMLQTPARNQQQQPPLAQPPASPTPTPIVLPSPTVKIDAYRASAGRIIGAALTRNKAQERLEYLTDHIGKRLSASEQRETAIAWGVRRHQDDGVANV